MHYALNSTNGGTKHDYTLHSTMFTKVDLPDFLTTERTWFLKINIQKSLLWPKLKYHKGVITKLGINKMRM